MKLNQRTKSKKGLFAVTALTLIAVLSVLMVYAAIIYNFTGGEVVVGGAGSSTITYSADNNEEGSWTSTLQSASVSDPWYSRLEVSAGDYSGPVTITWKLQQKTATWTDVPSASTTTSIILSGKRLGMLLGFSPYPPESGTFNNIKFFLFF